MASSLSSSPSSSSVKPVVVIRAPHLGGGGSADGRDSLVLVAPGCSLLSSSSSSLDEADGSSSVSGAGDVFRAYHHHPNHNTNASTSSPTTIIFREATVDWANAASAATVDGTGLYGNPRPSFLLRRANPVSDDGDDDDDNDDNDSGRRRTRRRTAGPYGVGIAMGEEGLDESEGSGSSSTDSMDQDEDAERGNDDSNSNSDASRPQHQPYEFTPFVSLDNVLLLDRPSPHRDPTANLQPRPYPLDHYDYYGGDINDGLDEYDDDNMIPLMLQPCLDADENADDANARERGPQQHPVDYSRFFEADLYSDRIALLCADSANDLDEGPSGIGSARETVGHFGGVDKDAAGCGDHDDDDGEGAADDDFSLSSEEASSILYDDDEDGDLGGGASIICPSDAFWEEGVVVP
jgi:hypothetical protein